MKVDLAAVTKLVNAAKVAPDSRRSALWCLSRLPKELESLEQTAESRYAEEINRLEQALLKSLAGEDAPAAAAVLGRLKVLHERLGLPPLPPQYAARTSRPKAQYVARTSRSKKVV